MINNKLFRIPEFKKLKRELRAEFKEYFRSIHSLILPISTEELQELISQHKELKKRFKKTPLVINKDNLLLKNACMSPQCPFYLKPQKRIDYHTNICLTLPPRFHIITKQNLKEDAKKIYDLIAVYFKDEFQHDLDPAQYNATKEQMIEWIETLKKKYNFILS